MRSRIGRRGGTLAVAALAVLGALAVAPTPASGEHDGAPDGGGDGPPVIEGSPMPQAHRLAGGGAVRVYGTGFLGVTAVTFGGAPAPDFRVFDGDLIVATVPAGAPGYAHVTVTDPEGTGSSDLDGDGEVDEPNTAGVDEAGLERSAILYTDAALTLGAATGLAAGDAVEVTLTDHQPDEDIALDQVSPLAGFLEHGPGDPDSFPPGSPYSDALTLTGTDESGANDPHDVVVRAGAGFNADDIVDYDPAATCPVTPTTADFGLDRCSIAASQLGMGRVESVLGLAGDPGPAPPTLELSATDFEDGSLVEVSGLRWNAAPHFGSDTVPDDPGETKLTIEICDAATLSLCTTAADPAAGVDLVRYRNAAGDAGLPIDGILSGAELSGTFTVAGAQACAAAGCSVRVTQERYDIAANGPIPGAVLELAVPLAAALPATSLSVEVAAAPANRPAPGGEFAFTVTVSNTGTGPVTVTELAADGESLDGQGDCAIDDVALGAGETSGCTYTEDFAGVGHDTLTRTVTATARAAQGTEITASGNATVSITVAPEPAIEVSATANPPTLAGAGGPFTAIVEIRNTGDGAVTITALTDEVYAPLIGQGDCGAAVGTDLAPGGRFTCSFEAEFVGTGGDSRLDTVEATAVDQAGTTVTAQDELTVTIAGPGPAARPAPRTATTTTSAGP